MRRNEIDAGSQPVRNLLTNPALETVGNRDVTLRTNYYTNPAMRSVSVTPQTMRTNLISNASMEASGSSVAVRTNLVTNPGVENSTALTWTRTNLVTSARGVSALSPYSAAVTQTPNIPISGVPEGITTALRVAYTTQANPGVSLLDVAEAGVTYAISAWIYHESVMSTAGTQGFAQAGIQSSPTPPAIEVGKWIKMSWVYTSTGTNNIGFRVSSNSGTGNGSFLITGMMIEKSSVVQPFFDGATTSLNLAKNPSFETNLDLWGSQWYGNGGGTGTFTRVAGAGISGGAAARKTWTTANTTNSLDVGITTTINVIPGRTYTSSIYQKSSFNSYLTCYVVWKDATNTVISTSSRTNNVGTPGYAWVRGYTTEVAPAGSVTGTFIFGPYTNSSTIPQGGTIDWDWAMIEEGDKLNPYYDGTAAAPADFTYAWTGTANNSTSVQRANNAAGYGVNSSSCKLWQTGTISYNGTKSLACESVASTGTSNGINFSFSGLPVGTYVFSAYVYLPAAYGTGIAACSYGSGGSVIRGNNITTTGSWQRTSVKFTVSTVGSTFLYLITDGASGAAVGARFYADAFMLEAVPDLSPYFDAATPRTNLLSNPSFEAGLSGWTWAGNPVVSIVHEVAPTYSGTKSMRVVCDGAVAAQGAFTSSRPTVKPDRYYTASAWVKADTGKSVRLDLGEWDGGSNIVGSRTSGTVVVGTGDWVRVSATRLMGPTAETADIVVRNVNNVAHTFWVDAVLLEQSETLNDYYDATTSPFTYTWTGTANASSSEQKATSVAGITWQGAMAPYQSTTKTYTGTKSLYVEGNPSDTAYQVFAGPDVSGLTVGTTYTLSAWVFVMPGSVGLELQPSGVGASASGRTATTGKWERVYMTFVAASSTHTLRLRTVANGKVSAFIDAMLLEQGVQLLPYFDGSTPAYENLAFTSTSGPVTTGISYSGTIWSRVTAPTGSSSTNARHIVPLSRLVKDLPYTVSVTVANDNASPVSIVLDWCDANYAAYTLAPGEIRRISTSGTGIMSRSYDEVYRFSDLQVNQSLTEQKSVLFKDWLIEAGTSLNNYYTGTGDFTYAWTGTANASTSVQRCYPPIGVQAGKNGADASNRFWGYSSTDETGTKTVKWVAPAGTPSTTWRIAGLTAFDYASIQAGKSYTLYFKFRASGWPANWLAPVQMSDGSATNLVMSTDNAYRLNCDVAGWQTYRRTFTANINALNTTWIYISLPSIPSTATDGVFEISEVMLLDNSHSGAYFDGSTVSADPDFSYVWNAAVDASPSRMLGTSVTGIGNTITHGQGISSTEWKSSGTKSVRILAKSNTNNDSFVDFRSLIQGNLKPNTTYTVAGTRYLKAPLTGTLWTAMGFRINIANQNLNFTYKPGYGIVNTAGSNRVVATFRTGSDTSAFAFLRIHNGSMEGNGDVWWDDLMLVEGDYDGRYLDGTKSNAKWDGTAHASTSVGYPTTLEGVAGMPLFYVESFGSYALNSAQLSPTSARTMYSIVDAPIDLPGANIDVFWNYGQDNLSDSPANKTITFRYQSEAGNTNSVLTRRTGGAGAIKGGIPTPGRYIMVGGLSENGFLFAGHGGSSVLVYDNLYMEVPHERIQVMSNNSTHTHIATYIYAGVHDDDTRAEVIKLLAQRHNVPALV